MNDALVAFLREREAASTVSPPPTHRLALPDKFDGNRRFFRGFLQQCNLLFTMNSASYSSDALKVSTMISLLSGDALTWVTPVIEHQHSCLSSYNEITTIFTEIFGDPNHIHAAEQALQSLTQGRNSVAIYGSNFRRLVVDTEWNESARVHNFRLGLQLESTHAFKSDDLKSASRIHDPFLTASLLLKLHSPLSRYNPRRCLGNGPSSGKISRIQNCI
jgi:hypothetical protein